MSDLNGLMIKIQYDPSRHNRLFSLSGAIYDIEKLKEEAQKQADSIKNDLIKKESFISVLETLLYNLRRGMGKG